VIGLSSPLCGPEPNSIAVADKEPLICLIAATGMARVIEIAPR
jgi:hypothetical protein